MIQFHFDTLLTDFEIYREVPIWIVFDCYALILYKDENFWKNTEKLVS